MVQQRKNDGLASPLNGYGDRFVKAGDSGHGADISSQREDDLDRMALRYASGLTSLLNPAVVYDIGCGYGTMAIKFANMGCVVVACDIEPMPALSEFARNTGQLRSEYIVQADACEINWSRFPQPDVVYSQRFLHYLRFDQAVELLHTLTQRADCTVYLSMSGLHSELGINYPKVTLQSRFAYLDGLMAQKHGIRQKVCLYDLEDAKSLADNCGLRVIDLWLSDFGNVKLVAER